MCKPGFTGNGYGVNGCVEAPNNACSALACRNGGTCVVNGTFAYCNCPPGTTQPLCERAIDPCTPNPCLNGGNCTSVRIIGRYRCMCPRGFSGNRCHLQQSTCGGVRTEMNGTLRYPTDPIASTYQHNSRCAWLIKTNITKVLNITFKSFHVEYSVDCRYDWLQVLITNYVA
jgi:cubilin